MEISYYFDFVDHPHLAEKITSVILYENKNMQ